MQQFLPAMQPSLFRMQRLLLPAATPLSPVLIPLFTAQAGLMRQQAQFSVMPHRFFWCNDLFVCLHDIFVNETRSHFVLCNASVNATRVYFIGRSKLAGPYDTIYYCKSIHVNATRVYFSVRSNCSNATGVYFRGGSEACSTTGVFNKGRSVQVKATRVYFSMKRIPDNDAGVFDKGKHETGKATRVYFTMKSPLGSNSGASGRVTGNKKLQIRRAGSGNSRHRDAGKQFRQAISRNPPASCCNRLQCRRFCAGCRHPWQGPENANSIVLYFCNRPLYL